LHTLPGSAATASSYSSNNEEGIYLIRDHLDHNITDEVTWASFDQPVIEMEEDLTINDNGKLTLTPGLEWRFGPSVGIWIGYSTAGDLVAMGTQTLPIVFTSVANSPAKGDWHGIMLDTEATAATQLTYVEIGYAGEDTMYGSDGTACSDGQADDEIAALHVYSAAVGGKAFLTYSTIHDSDGWAVICAEGICGDLEAAALHNTYTYNDQGVADCN
jgi:hypothetical protein